MCWTISLGASFSSERSVNIIRICFWVLGLVIETAFTLLAAASSSALLIDLEWWAERFAALTLIVIGEGIIGIYQQFSTILSSPNSGNLASVYGSIFAVVGLYRILFGIYFKQHTHHLKGSTLLHYVWGYLHFPLQLEILLFTLCECKHSPSQL